MINFGERFFNYFTYKFVLFNYYPYICLLLNIKTPKNIMTTMTTFKNNFNKVQDLVYNNQSGYIKTFNSFLNENKELKKMFFAMDKKEQDKNFKAIINMIIGMIAINETFKTPKNDA